LALQQILLTTTTMGTLGTSMAMTIPRPAAAVTAQAVTAAAAPASSRSTYWPLGQVAFSLLPWQERIPVVLQLSRLFVQKKVMEVEVIRK
jgi:hypothetical protein